MNAYHLVGGGSHARWENDEFTLYTPGDGRVMRNLSASELVVLKDRIEPVAEVAPAEQATPAAAPAPDFSDLIAGNVTATRAAIAELTEVDHVRRVLEAEQANRGRAGVIRAAEDRIAELEGQADEGEGGEP